MRVWGRPYPAFLLNKKGQSRFPGKGTVPFPGTLNKKESPFPDVKLENPVRKQSSEKEKGMKRG